MVRRSRHIAYPCEMVDVYKMLEHHAYAVNVLELDVYEALNVGADRYNGTFRPAQERYDRVREIGGSVVALAVEHYPIELINIYHLQQGGFVLRVGIAPVSDDMTDGVEVYHINAYLLRVGIERLHETSPVSAGKTAPEKGYGF